ncbi:hypothetical protein D030_0115B, partial [Vibrio parahaemolyticus AQ3810]
VPFASQSQSQSPARLEYICLQS